jgi:hypothetical protein
LKGEFNTCPETPATRKPALQNWSPIFPPKAHISVARSSSPCSSRAPVVQPGSKMFQDNKPQAAHLVAPQAWSTRNQPYAQ